MDEVSKNPANNFIARKNMLLFYTYTNIEKAKEYGEMMLTDADEFYPIHKKELYFMLGNIHFLSSEYKKAKEMYR